MANYTILGEDQQYGTHMYMVDTAEVIQELPLMEIGSTALVVDTSDVYILDNHREWKKL